jgi:hypothetical protein
MSSMYLKNSKNANHRSILQLSALNMNLCLHFNSFPIMKSKKGSYNSILAFVRRRKLSQFEFRRRWGTQPVYRTPKNSDPNAQSRTDKTRLLNQPVTDSSHGKVLRIARQPTL